MSGYTKGPWKWATYLDGFTCCTLETGERSLVYHRAGWAIPEDSRNLIAAAPELLEALKAAMPELHHSPNYKQIAKQCHAAIAKAEASE